MSASWDEDREGDMLGVDEFQKNVNNVREGLQRSRDNAVLRDNMARLDDGEMAQALADLEKREQKAAKQKSQSWSDKLEGDLDWER